MNRKQKKAIKNQAMGRPSTPRATYANPWDVYVAAKEQYLFLQPKSNVWIEAKTLMRDHGQPTAEDVHHRINVRGKWDCAPWLHSYNRTRTDLPF